MREAGGLSQEVAANRLGITTVTYRKIKYGFVSPRVEFVRRFRELCDEPMAAAIPDFQVRHDWRGNHFH